MQMLALQFHSFLLSSTAFWTMVLYPIKRCLKDAGERVEAGLLHNVMVIQHLPFVFH